MASNSRIDGHQRPSRDAGRPDHRRALGLRGEQFAAEHLQRLGLCVIARNVRTRHGEIDLVAGNRSVLAFVEVKTRRARTGTTLYPLEGLRVGQRVRLRRLATAWLAETALRPRPHTIRFDAIGVTIDARGQLLCLDHLEGAW